MEQKSSLLDMIELADRWKWAGEDLAAVQFSNMSETLYTQDEFRELNPALLEIMGLDELLPNADLMRFSMAFWSKPRLTLPAIDPTTMESMGEHHVAYIIGFRGHQANDLVIVDSSHYMCAQLPSGVTYPYNSSVVPLVVTRTWLDTHYSGWEERYQVALSLELSDEELTDFVTSSNTPSSKLDLPDSLTP